MPLATHMMNAKTNINEAVHCIKRTSMGKVNGFFMPHP
jgi:hypothetical protein